MAALRRIFPIVNERGLHARAATALARLVEPFDAQVALEKDGQSARASSVMELLLLCGQRGSQVTVVAQGPDAERVLDAIGELIGDRFGEPT